jgi:predicted 3-demethylubiquinone-9 3-methyltransferase (glyoxalase superfamily)
MFKHNEAFSFQIATDDQQETDRYWNAIVDNDGQESQCGWCKDKWGVSWQITPRVLTEAMAAGGEEASWSTTTFPCGNVAPPAWRESAKQPLIEVGG